MNLSMKQNHGRREQTGSCQEGGDSVRERLEVWG